MTATTTAGVLTATGRDIVTDAGFRCAPAFDASGAFAACLAGDPDGRGEATFAESWTLTPDGPHRLLRVGVDGALTSVRAVPTGDGGMLVAAGSRVEMITARARTRLAVPAGARIHPAPGLGAVAVTGDTGGDTTIHRIGPAGPALIARLPGPVTRPAPAGPHHLLLTCGHPASARAVLLDLHTGDVTALPWPAGTGPGVALLAGGGSVLLAEAPSRPGRTGHRLLLAPLSGDGPARFLPDHPGLHGTVAPVAIDPTGDLVAVVAGQGARSVLAVADTRTGRVRRVPGPPGTLMTAAGWSTEGLWLLGSAPHRPSAFGRTGPAAGRIVWDAPARRWSGGRVETFTGPGGPVEAVVCGPDWRAATRVVVALHGGPRAHWQLGFERTFQTFAAAGITVVAPNQRGSTGYGRAHELAVTGAWGGPDLDDVTAIGTAIADARGPRRSRPALYGGSYGAHLAVLAAAVGAPLWDRCVAVGVFLSAAEIRRDGGPGVRALVDRLDGTRPIHDAVGPRDLLALAPRLRVPLLVVHGGRDTTIPVGHARRLVARLAQLGTPDVTYLELPDRGHAAVGERADDDVMSAVLTFLTRDPPRR